MCNAVCYARSPGGGEVSINICSSRIAIADDSDWQTYLHLTQIEQMMSNGKGKIKGFRVYQEGSEQAELAHKLANLGRTERMLLPSHYLLA
jgi:ABC-type lipoprotein release transport system permease subunit